MQVLVKKERQDIAALEQPPAGAPADVKCYKATFKPAIKKGSTQEFDLVATITGIYKPNPAKIEQTEKQYVEYLDNLYLLSPYVVQSQSTVVSGGAQGECRVWGHTSSSSMQGTKADGKKFVLAPFHHA